LCRTGILTTIFESATYILGMIKGHEDASSSGARDGAGSTLRICGATNVGLHRRQNEDTFVIADLSSGDLDSPCNEIALSLSNAGFLLMVCDGMGGAAAGEVAARIAASSIRQNLLDGGQAVADHPGESLETAVAVANRAILDEADQRPEERGMGTTCTAAIVTPGALTVAQVGDSRAYLLRDGRLQPLTTDQSLAAELVAAGVLNAEEARNFPHRSVLRQALGSKGLVQPVISEYSLVPGDRLLLCSDGLHDPVPDSEIRDALSRAADLTGAAQTLVDRALAAGGPDNITVVVADYRA
jgi:protein phosphatase